VIFFIKFLNGISLKYECKAKIFFLFFLTLNLFLAGRDGYARVQSVKGVMDIREDGFQKAKIYSLIGEWELYWNQLLESDTFRSGSPPKLDLWGNVPSY
jgi:hypothetical protein